MRLNFTLGSRVRRPRITFNQFKPIFVEPLPSDMTMRIDKINDDIDYNSMGDCYYCNIGIYE